MAEADFLSDLAAAQPDAPQPADAGGDFMGDLALTHAAAASPQAPPPAEQPSWIYRNLLDPQGWKRALGLTARNVVEGATAIPTMVGDALGLQSSQGRNALLAGLPQPQTGLEKAGGFLEQGMAGGGAQGPVDRAVLGIVRSAPSGFLNPDQAKAQVLSAMLRKAQAQGLVVPPATTNPTLANRTLESIAGKIPVQQAAQAENDAARTRIASSAMGLNPDAPMIQSTPRAVMDEAGQAYAAARQIPQFSTSPTYAADLDHVLATQRGANASFPGAASPDVKDLVKTYKVSSMTGDSGVSAMNLLRDKASEAFAKGNTEMYRAYKAVSAAIQAELERAPTSTPEVTKQLVAARRRMGIAGDVNDAIMPDGTVTGSGLVQASPPPGSPLKTAADFAENYPLANATATKKGSQAHQLGVWGSILAGLEAARFGAESGHGGIGTGVAAAASIPAIREVVKRYLLSPMGQRGALPAARAAVNPSAVSGVGATGAAAADFLNQLDQVEQQRQQSQRGHGAIPKAAVTGNSTL